MTVRRPRRRHRIVIPMLVGAVLLAVTLVTREVDQPDQTDPGFLSPVATGADGGSRLAASLGRRGVVVQRETDTLRALRATRPGPVTLFVPAPELLHPRTVNYLGLLPDGTRLVLVDPPRRVLAAAGLPLRPNGRRWAARAVAPHTPERSCPLAEIIPATTAAVARQRYASIGAPGSVDLCYSAGLARLPGPAESVVVGASDPFRNGRIDEWDNHAFATGLLATSGRVVWLDLDGPAPPPPEPSPSPTRQLPEPAEDEPDGREDPGGGQNGGTAPGNGPGGEPANPGGPSASGAPHSLWSAFPAWFWALLLQLALAALLIAAGRARRLGPPTPEPLPVTVPAAETVHGRARLYQQARARESAAQVLRTAARSRLARWLHLPAGAPPAAVAAAVAARTGDRPDAVHELLYGDAPDSDRDLLELAGDLDRTTRAEGDTR
ncbi:DUF4350 domain-containing protein [Micromonospora sp. WMMD1082]|uniref:DUF4350 domain-containing protein n=1 Tax=Micromonospora sp. WMMD1082 TaxID=3016104 RepID=UPI0024172404|nr:DUF4350 domain-containing protein [Micromonospora sp. WMMD1082]MDG4793170.1 DUF4350 domain-containing protein [Micromonospora sp. WMMD1082]